jgi:hypothetical protein
MQHTIEQLIQKIEAMKNEAIALHRERCRYSANTDITYDKKLCEYMLSNIQALAGDIYNDREGDEIKTEMEYKKL